MRVAVMQPYFAPYLGYFRLLQAADVFVLFDCVQFPRRGWVHRNQLPDRLARPQWLTLPIVKAPQGVRIRDLELDVDRFPEFLWSWRRFPALNADPSAATPSAFLEPQPMIVDYLADALRATADLLEVSRPIVRSSELDVNPALRGQDRVIEIARALGARRYVNAPGGRALYDGTAFARHGITLEFLPTYEGSRWSLLQRLATESTADLIRELALPSRLEAA